MDFNASIFDNIFMQIYEYIHAGGWIMYLLLMINVIGLAMMANKFLTFHKQKKASQETAKTIIGEVRGRSKGKGPEIIIEMAKQELGSYITKIEHGLNTIKIIASIAPLLGLLGTVIGVLMAFQMMSQKGLQDPSFFAEGIYMALITTVGGMIVAIPHFIGHSYLIGMLDGLESHLEKEILKKVL